MDAIIRNAQLKILKVFSRFSETFALSGGTALELYYLKHRFSRDLDFFSPEYSDAEIRRLVREFEKAMDKPVKLESQLRLKGRARVHFYSVPVQGSPAPLKIDFVEDVFADNPEVQEFNHVRVYSAEEIYGQKILAITGGMLEINPIGAEKLTGRNEARDVVDLYFLSKNIKPLRLFLGEAPRTQQRGMVLWYRTFSRQEFKMECLDFDLYDKKVNGAEMIRHLEAEVRAFMNEGLE